MSPTKQAIDAQSSSGLSTSWVSRFSTKFSSCWKAVYSCIALQEIVRRRSLIILRGVIHTEWLTPPQQLQRCLPPPDASDESHELKAYQHCTWCVLFCWNGDHNVPRGHLGGWHESVVSGTQWLIGEASYVFFLRAETNVDSNRLGEHRYNEGIGEGGSSVGNCRMRERGIAVFVCWQIM